MAKATEAKVDASDEAVAHEALWCRKAGLGSAADLLTALLARAKKAEGKRDEAAIAHGRLQSIFQNQSVKDANSLTDMMAQRDAALAEVARRPAVKRDRDATWLHFKTKAGLAALINLDTIADRNVGIVHNAINQWINEQNATIATPPKEEGR